jgi:hypothetical protein
VRVDTTRVINSFDPDSALGSSIDVLSRVDINKVFTPHIIQEALSAGWGPITYRNNTELRMAAWHWTENGTWSDAGHRSGYFTGSTELKDPIKYILAYALPHRGFATSGDRPVPGENLTYWKSNPYLTSKFTGEDDELHPQWVVVDLKTEKSVNAVRIQWENPYATHYQVEYWAGTDALDFDAGPKGEWKVFSSGVMKNGRSGPVTLKLTANPVRTRYVRILMTRSSNTCDEHGSQDVRNCVGYAIQQIALGTMATNGTFSEVSKDPNEPLTTYCASSIDPWHSDEDVRDDGFYQHTGFDTFFTSGITNDLPAMIPVTMLYGTPDDAAAQIAYIEKRGYPIGYIEMGEEPDGKHAMPEDYGALYLQWAAAIHKVDPKLKLGGPIFEGVNEDIRLWPDAQGRTSWMGRFVAYLKAHDRLSDLAFVSFEHYPFLGRRASTQWSDLYKEPEFVSHIIQVWRDNGLPTNIPFFMTEGNFGGGSPRFARRSRHPAHGREARHRSRRPLLSPPFGRRRAVMIEFQRLILGDRVRNDAFAKALARTIVRGRTTVADLLINSANLGTAGSLAVTVNISSAATQALLTDDAFGVATPVQATGDLPLTGGNTLTLTAAAGGAADGYVGNTTDVTFQAAAGIAQSAGHRRSRCV